MFVISGSRTLLGPAEEDDIENNDLPETLWRKEKKGVSYK